LRNLVLMFPAFLCFRWIFSIWSEMSFICFSVIFAILFTISAIHSQALTSTKRKKKKIIDFVWEFWTSEICRRTSKVVTSLFSYWWIMSSSSFLRVEFFTTSSIDYLLNFLLLLPSVDFRRFKKKRPRGNRRRWKT